MCDFSEKRQKKGKIFENLSKNVQNLKIFWKGAGNCMQQTAGKGPTVNRYHEKHLSWDYSDSQKNRIDQVFLWLTGHFDFFNLE